ncbi:tripartite motif-containing protein 29-like [Hyperolius riggenbachi]|uniref:tripartite motif-containing protein 29-like n=1 Tax=Hyperolius riggenbachi TaxID=752182 RepID=UPI0035A3C27E
MKVNGAPFLSTCLMRPNLLLPFQPAQPHQEESGVFCTYCVDSAVPAVKSCLMCEASLCDKHLKVHSKSPEHVIIDPTTSLRNRKCSVHKKILEYYCTQDNICICVSCRLDGEHRGHDVQMLDEASERKKMNLRQDVQRLIIQRQKAEEGVQNLQVHQKLMPLKVNGITERVTALFRDIRRQLEDLEKKVLSEVSRQKEQMLLFFPNRIQHLEFKKEKLSGKMCHIEELCNMTDPLTVLLDPDTGDLCDPDVGINEVREECHKFGGDLDVSLMSNTLHILSERKVQRVNSLCEII